MATLATPRRVTVSEALLRQEALNNAVADLRLEGLAPTAEVLALSERFVQGELTEAQLVSAVIGE